MDHRVLIVGTKETDASNLCTFYYTLTQASQIILKDLGWVCNPDVLPSACNGSFSKWGTSIVCSDKSRVTEIDLSGAGLEGVINPALGELDALEVLRLDHNKFIGGIPLTFGDLHDLITLDLGHNLLAGRVPTELSQAVKLKLLAIDNNCLGGPWPGQQPGIPTTLCGLTGASIYFSGVLPPSCVAPNAAFGARLPCAPAPEGPIWNNVPLSPTAH